MGLSAPDLCRLSIALGRTELQCFYQHNKACIKEAKQQHERSRFKLGALYYRVTNDNSTEWLRVKQLTRESVILEGIQTDSNREVEVVLAAGYMERICLPVEPPQNDKRSTMTVCNRIEYEANDDVAYIYTAQVCTGWQLLAPSTWVFMDKH